MEGNVVFQQWQLVLSFPWRLRFHLARDPALLSRMLRAFLHSVFAWQRHRGRTLGIADGQTGAVTLIQKFGGTLNLNPHFHAITPDGLFVEGGPDGRLVFHPLPPPTDAEVRRLAARVARRLGKLARRYLAARDEEYLDPDDEQAAVDHAQDTALRPPVRPQTSLLGAEPTATAGEPETDDAPKPETDPYPLLPPLPPRRTPWARLLMHTLKVDGLDCPRCHARMVLLALIIDARVIERILKHLRLPHVPPPVRSPAIVAASRAVG